MAMKKNVQAFWKWVEDRMETLGVPSISQLEDLAGLGGGTINKRKNALRFPTVEMAEGMCRALRVSWSELWEKAGFVDSVREDELTGVDAEIYRALQGRGDDFKRRVLQSIGVWGRATTTPPPGVQPASRVVRVVGRPPSDDESQADSEEQDESG
jgi:transcriptional regulator with XRE-family HTH domain